MYLISGKHAIVFFETRMLFVYSNFVSLGLNENNHIFTCIYNCTSILNQHRNNHIFTYIVGFFFFLLLSDLCLILYYAPCNGNKHLLLYVQVYFNIKHASSRYLSKYANFKGLILTSVLKFSAKVF